MNTIAIAAQRREDWLTALTLLTAAALGGLMSWLVPLVPPVALLPAVSRLGPLVPPECLSQNGGGAMA